MRLENKIMRSVRDEEVQALRKKLEETEAYYQEKIEFLNSQIRDLVKLLEKERNERRRIHTGLRKA